MAEPVAHPLLQIRTEPGVVRLQGDLLCAAIEPLKEMSLPMPEGQGAGSRLEIALGQITAMDTAGLAFLIGWQVEAAAQSVTLRYTHPPKAMRAMVQVYGLDDWMILEGV
ncbi:MAG: STAS domain-containing protein, partial [Halothiobacillus sp.]